MCDGKEIARTTSNPEVAKPFAASGDSNAPALMIGTRGLQRKRQFLFWSLSFAILGQTYIWKGCCCLIG
jgi:hypothetical protein